MWSNHDMLCSLIGRNAGYRSSNGAEIIASSIFDYSSKGRLSCFSDQYLIGQLDKVMT